MARAESIVVARRQTIATVSLRDGTRRLGHATPRPRVAAGPRKTLIVQGGDPDDEHPPFEEHYSLSEDKQRLVEVVGFTGGRSNGFTMSRVWDRQPQ
jgi:hypothetical protein